VNITITRKQLSDAGACSGGIHWFQQLAGKRQKSLTVDLDNLMYNLVLREQNAPYVSWLQSRNLIPPLRVHGKSLEGVDLRYIAAEQSNWERSSLTDCDFGIANLRESRLLDVTLWGCRMYGAHLDSAILTSVHLRRPANAEQSTWTRAALRSCTIEDTNLSYANMTRAMFENCHFQSTNLEDAYMHAATFVDCTFTDVCMKNADLRNVSFFFSDKDDGVAQLSCIDFTGATRYPTDHKLPGWTRRDNRLRKSPTSHRVVKKG